MLSLLTVALAGTVVTAPVDNTAHFDASSGHSSVAVTRSGAGADGFCRLCGQPNLANYDFVPPSINESTMNYFIA